MLTLLVFLIRLHQNFEKVNNKINSYIKNSNEKNIHDARTSIRKFNASYLTLPKRYRKGCLLADYKQLATEFFKVNSEIRDIDIIIEKLKNYEETAQISNIIDLLKNNRQSKLDSAKIIALNLKNMNSKKIIEKIDITEKELQKIYIKNLLILIKKIETNFLFFFNDNLKIEELHELRKDCKKLRYLLELMGKENSDATRMIKILQNIQDILGSIQDSDITIDYLKNLESNKEIQEIINNEIDKRRVKYEEFTIFCNRRLHISKNSFFIRMKSFTLRNK